MRRLTSILVLLALSAGCASPDNFGNVPDAGDAGGDPDAADGGNHDVRKAQIGEACRTPSDCVAGSLCIGTASNSFECMARCSTAYELCDDGSVCLPVMSQDASICYTGGDLEHRSRCANNLDCAGGLLCFGATNDFYCLPACGSPDDCEAGEFCSRIESGAGLCRPSVGAGCEEDVCPEALACSSDDADIAALFPGGYCTLRDCTSDVECPGTAVCREVAFTGGSARFCLNHCDDRSDCRFNGQYDCLDSTVCGSSSDPVACRAMFGEDSLCVPGPL